MARDTLTEESLDLERLQRHVGPLIFQRGQNYYMQQRVELDFVEPTYASCTVVGRSGVYDVRIELDRGTVYFDCDCPYAAGGKICKHIVASCMAVRDHLRAQRPIEWREQLVKVIQSLESLPESDTPAPFVLVFSLQSELYYQTYTSWKLQPYLLSYKSLPQRARQALEGGEPLGKVLEGVQNLSGLLKTPTGAIERAGCLNRNSQAVMVANLLLNQYRNYAFSTSLADALTLLSIGDTPIFQGNAKKPAQKLLQTLGGYTSEHARLKIEISRVKQGVRLAASLTAADHSFALNSGDIHVISTGPFWVLVDRYLIEIDETRASEASVVLRTFQDVPELLVPLAEEDEFLEKFYLPLAKAADLNGDAVSWQSIEVEPVKRLYLNDEGGALQAELRFGYGDFEVPFDPLQPEETIRRLPDSWTLARIHRNASLEQQIHQELGATDYGLKRVSTTSGVFELRSRVRPLDFLLRNASRLARDGYEIYGEDRLKSARVNRNKPTISFNVTSGIDWFDVQTVVSFGEIQVALKEIRRALRRHERYVKLADGTIGEIPEEWIQHYRHLFALGNEAEGNLRLSNLHVTLIDQLLAEDGEAGSWQVDQEFLRRSQQLRDFKRIESQELPQGFVGELRHYQKAGFDWLHFLHEYGFGGCLADDMGLGKTVQVLVFLLSLRERKHPQHADLIVLPRSLLVNWQRETNRFTPDLKVLEYFGAQRTKELSDFDQVDLVVTTYGVMLRDLDLLRQYNFHYVILDESQAIKNPAAQTARAARQLQSDHRLVMTGTPVENSTIELWSQFSFLNPGLLGNLDYFKREFAGPIERKNDEQQALFLRQMVYPFILRRTKSQVAPELPPRTERVVYTDMESGQRKLYNRTRDYYRGLLLGMLDGQEVSDTSGKVRMKILEGLLRLRQICNHPHLMDRNFRGDSGKFELLLETLQTLYSEGHKALVFSQFVEMLRLVRSELDRRNIPYEYLDGSTQDRQDRVDSFQLNQDIPFFLISLKAGGVGLNLTSADYVIHIDPWWNPAVEMQATDRTHRIGQDKPVFVYKLIVRDSVEEKIVQLQERKKELVDQLVATENSFLKSLTKDDVSVLFG